MKTESTSLKMSRGRLNAIEYDADSGDETDVYVAEFVWPSKYILFHRYRFV